MSRVLKRVAIIGAGIAGAACARLLAQAGLEVALFDKSRGVGGRMATRRAEWAADDGTPHPARFDHGAPGFTAHSPDFARFAEQAAEAGLLSRWVPRVAPGNDAIHTQALWVPTPDMPSLCRALAAGAALHTERAIEALQRGPKGWRLACAGADLGADFDAVIIATPPQQAAPLLQPHRADWSEHARALSMAPGWVLMAVTGAPTPAPLWDVARPASGPLGFVIRNDTKPGRTRAPGVAHWVAHATANWSQAHLESPAADVQAALQSALADVIGGPQTWRHAAAHRWRYATAIASQPSGSGFWWDANTGVGVCGEALGGTGVEGAWRSACALALHCMADSDDQPAPDVARAAASFF